MATNLRSFLLGVLLAIGLGAMAAQQTINIGSSANDGTGDTLRAAGQKMNANFTELYEGKAGLADANVFTGTSNVFDSGAGADELTISNGSVAMEGVVTVNGSLLVGADPVPAQITGTFTLQYSGFSGTVDSDWRYVINGNLITIMPTEPISGTSNSTVFSTNTTIPAGLRPARTFLQTGILFNNSGTGGSVGCIQVTTGGNVNFGINISANTCNTGGWGNTGTKGAFFTAAGFPTFTYPLN